MRKTKKTAFVSILIIIVSVIAFILVTVFMPKNKIETKETNVDNSYNNMVSSAFSPALIQLQDKLVLRHLSKIGFNEGTYVIRNGKATKIGDDNVYLGYVLNGQLLDLSSDPVMYFDFTTKTFQPFSDINLPKELGDANIIDNTLYSISDSTLFIYKDNRWEKVVSNLDLALSEDMFLWTNLYLDGSFIYYTNRSNGKSAICRYACKEKSTVSFPCELGTEIYNTFFVYNNYIFIQCGQNRIIKLDTNTNKVTTLFETQTGTIIMNCYQENVFFTINSHEDEKGIYWIDKSGHISKLTENEAIEIDILDEEYVYFIDMNYTIYRVKLSDLSLEKVF